MTNPAPSATELAKTVTATPHPARNRMFLLIILGLAFLVMAAQQLAWLSSGVSTLGILGALLMLAAAFFFLINGIRGLRVLPAVQILNLALNQITSGRFSVAEELLSKVGSEARAIRRIAELHRATIALGRGDAETARVHVDNALAIRPTYFDKAAFKVTEFRAISLRAFCKALTDDRKGATEDIGQVRRLALEPRFGPTVVAGESVLLDPLARVALAETILLARAGEHDALRRQLQERRRLILEGSPPRDRALLRGLERMLRTKVSTPYRRAAKRTVDGDEPDVEDWIERVLPEVAEFVPRVRRKIAPTPASDERATTTHVPRKTTTKLVGKNTERYRRILLVVCAVAIVGLYSFLQSGSAAGPGPDAPTMFVVVFPLFFAAFLALTLGRRYWTVWRDRKRIQSAFLSLAEGDGATAEGILASIPPNAQRSYLGLASLTLARCATRRGDFRNALERAERGLVYVEHRSIRAFTSDVLQPELVTERAVALAALGRTDEALSEVAALATGFAFRARSVFRVRLMALVATGEMAEAARHVETHLGPLPIDPRTELVADLVRAVHSPSGVGVNELQRLSEEVQEPENRTFLRSSAPKLLDELLALRDGLPHDRVDEMREGLLQARSVDESSEAEALAESEMSEDPRRAEAKV